MRKKVIKYSILFVALTLHGLFACAQVISTRLIREFPSSVTRKVCSELNSISNNEVVQLWLAQMYMWQDSLLQAEFIMERSFDKSKLDRLTDSTTWLIEDKLIHRLNEHELILYKKERKNKRPIPVYKGKVYVNAEMDSQFGSAIQNGEELKLNDSQYNSLFNFSCDLHRRVEYSNAHLDSGYFDRAAYESDKLSIILTEKQYNDLLIFIHKDACIAKAKYAWFDMKAAGLNRKFSEEKSIRNILMYFLLREHITARYANEKEKIAQMLGALKMPEELVALQEKKSTERARLSKYAW